MTAAQRNELVRGADWRFLLPGGPPRRVLCVAGDRLTAATHAVAQEAVSSSAPGTCDTAVLEAPRKGGLGKARDALAAGSGLYAEWRRPVLGGRRTVVRRLERAGFQDVRCWMAWPLPPRGLPRFWIPLESPRAARHILSGRPAMGGAGPLRNAVLGAAWRIARLAGLLPMRVTAVRVGAPARPGAIIGAGESALDGAAPPGRLHAALLTGGESALNKVVALLFDDDDDDALLVVKAPRVAEAAGALDRERDVLESVAGAGRGVTGVPRVLGTVRFGDWPLLVESAECGQPAWALLAAGEDPVLHAEAVAALLIEVGLATAGPSLADCDWVGRILEPKAEECRARHPGAGEEIAAALEAAAALGSLPAVAFQGDCTPWNVLVDATGHRLVDWEGGLAQGIPASDLTYFLAHEAMFVEDTFGSAREVDTYRRLLDVSTPLGGVRERCELRYASALGLPVSLLRPLRLVTWLQQGRPDLLRIELDHAR